MIIYIVCFVLSSILIAISNKIKNKFAKKIIEVIAILLPCLLAGMRATTVGTDVEVYVKPLFDLAQSANSYKEFLSMSWWAIWEYKTVADFEFLFTLLVYVITSITNNFQIVLFFIQTLIIVPIYIGLKKYKEFNNKLWLAMLIFYFIFYNISFNIMRQLISLGIVFYGMSCLINSPKGKGKFFLSTIVAYFFHKSALLALLVYFIYIIVKQDFKKEKLIIIGKYRIKIQKLALILILFFSIIFVFNSSFLSKILSFLGFNYYNVYINGNIVFNTRELIKYLPIIAILFFQRKKVFEDKNSYFYLLTFSLEIIVSYFSTVNIYAIRIGYIFQIFNIIFYIKLIQSTKHKRNQGILSFIIIAYLAILWNHTYVITGATETVPYRFFFE